MRLNALVVALAVSVGVSLTGSIAANAQQATDSSSRTVKVQSGDTLSGIAKNHQTTYHRLFNANTSISNPNLIFPGQELRIPAADEVLQSRALPVEAAVYDAPAPQPQAYVAPQPEVMVESAPAPAPVAAAPTPVAPEAAPVYGGVWDQLAQCESGGNWAINTGNGFYGGLQFTLSSWQAVGGSGYPHHASKAEQIARAESLLALQGWGAWPACTAKLGLR